MKLRYSATSPYVRKVMMVIHERGLSDRVELEKTDAWSPETDLPSNNPLGKVPALVLGDGPALFDSPVIVEYLDTLAGPDASLFPATGPDRWTALRFQALADGICDAAILVLRRHSLRTAVNRFAEAIALCAVVSAGMFPIVHLGRPWLFWWVYPHPATYEVWPQFRSTLTWDF